MAYMSGKNEGPDLNATNFELEQAVLANSMETYRHHESSRKVGASPARSSSTTSASLPLYASDPTVAAAAARRSSPSPPPNEDDEEYPPTVQELVMNGFELRKVVHAYELIGDRFDDVLAFLMANP